MFHAPLIMMDYSLYSKSLSFCNTFTSLSKLVRTYTQKLSYRQKNVEESLVFSGVDLYKIFFLIGRLFFCLEVESVLESFRYPQIRLVGISNHWLVKVGF